MVATCPAINKLQPKMTLPFIVYNVADSKSVSLILDTNIGVLKATDGANFINALHGK